MWVDIWFLIALDGLIPVCILTKLLETQHLMEPPNGRLRTWEELVGKKSNDFFSHKLPALLASYLAYFSEMQENIYTSHIGHSKEKRLFHLSLFSEPMILQGLLCKTLYVSKAFSLPKFSPQHGWYVIEAGSLSLYTTCRQLSQLETPHLQAIVQC